MTRGHRRVHGILWPLLAPALLVALWALIRARPGDRFTPPLSPPPEAAR